ncbi:hypothetical protein GGI24_005514, partial [Coemansia furcata]
MKALFGGEFAGIIKTNASHLHRQQKLIATMKSKCPKDTPRWLALGGYCSWQVDHYYELESYYNGGDIVSSGGSGNTGGGNSGSGNTDITKGRHPMP